MKYALILTLTCVVSISAADAGQATLEYAPAPVDNPLKGLVPYAGDKAHFFPHSMEFSYFPLSAFVVGEERYDWRTLEKFLDRVGARGHQAVFRCYLEYPGRKIAIPDYLLGGGLKVYRWKGKRTNLTPDYSDKALRECIRNFIATLGKRYDGDPRIGFLTAGMLGKWGEWHTHPRNDLWADKELQNEVMDACEKAFDVTPVLLRYPAGPQHYSKASNVDRKLGYHDDSFAWATLDTGEKGDEWFFLTSMKKAGRGALDKWKKYPIGGEIRPETWGVVFDEDPGDDRVQDFEECVRKTHVTWLMDTGMFRKKTYTQARRKRAEAQVRMMGYEFHVPTVTWSQSEESLRVTVTVENRGVAPFYYDWPIRFALVSVRGRLLKTFAGEGKLTGLLPGRRPRVWRERFDMAAIAPGRYRLALQVANPLPGAPPLRFANKSQDRYLAGWLTLTTIEWR